MLIVTFVAGTNEASNAHVLADAFLEGAQSDPDVLVEKIRLKDLPLAHFTLEHYRGNAFEEEAFTRIRSLVRGAKGIVIATPVWNFSVPAHLKNLIDRLGAFCLDHETRSKGQLPATPFFFLFTGGAPVPVWTGIMRFTTSHLPESIRYYGGSIAGKHYEGKCMVSRREFGLVVDVRPASLERVRRKGRKFARLMRYYAVHNRLPLSYRLLAQAYRLSLRIVSKF